jgi:hypothetical protein
LLVSRKEQIIRNQTAKGQTEPEKTNKKWRRKREIRLSVGRSKFAVTIKTDSFAPQNTIKIDSISVFDELSGLFGVLHYLLIFQHLEKYFAKTHVWRAYC